MRKLNSSSSEGSSVDSNGRHEYSRTDSGTEHNPAIASNVSSPKTATNIDGSSLVCMNASLRDTHQSLCQQQQHLDAITRERDRLQAHLVVALERASNQRQGLWEREFDDANRK